MRRSFALIAERRKAIITADIPVQASISICSVTVKDSFMGFALSMRR